MREVFNALRWIVRTGAPWRYLPCNFPPWAAVHQQAQRWIAAGCFEAMVHDLRALLRDAAGRAPDSTAVILDGKTLRSGHRAGYDGSKRTKGSKIHAAVDTLGHLMALRVTPANAKERAQVGALTDGVQEAEARGIELVVVRLPDAKQGFVLLPQRWVVERSFAWATRFRRLAKDYERLPEIVAGLHLVAFACLMLHKMTLLPLASP